MRRLALVLALGTVPTPAWAQVVTDPPTRVAPNGQLRVELLVGPHAAPPRGGPGCAVERLWIAPRGGVPEHVHEASDEIVTILRGAGTFTLAGQAVAVRAGQTIVVPKGVKHSFTAASDGPVDALQIYDPAGPEARFVPWPTPPQTAPSQLPPSARPPEVPLRGS